MVDPIKTQETWAVEPFDMEAWVAFAKKDRFLQFQMNDMTMRCLAQAGEDQAKYDSLVRAYLEAQYNGCYEDSVLARRWNAFIKARNRRVTPEPLTTHQCERMERCGTTACLEILSRDGGAS